ncbi:hypothetical protein Agabi119p4_6216 [Agaricus bisporus var. burnettii]|uniref:Uncharacterized protein n=1 Tax=Agaricus bisporus var. burnettii TaxID=192524 RepID=A0A8H7EZF9_AGABI|nr:hypothetical protein Agabi119p4_6216 [Agaricus bisporus var. burnettii]
MTAYYCAASFHTGLHPSQISTYSSLAGALTPVSPPSLFTSPSRRRVPQTACKKVSNPAFEPIAFDYFEQARQGVALRDFTVKSQTGINQILSGANEPVLATAGIHKLDLRIMWVGYEHMGSSFSFPVSRTTTKGQLVAQIAKLLRTFCENAKASASSAPAWRIAPDAISFEQLYLVALYSFGGAVCQVDLAVDPTPEPKLVNERY